MFRFDRLKKSTSNTNIWVDRVEKIIVMKITFVFVETISIFNFVVFQNFTLKLSESRKNRNEIVEFFFSFSPEKISEWNLDPKLIDELVDGSRCRSCLAEPLNYVW